MIPVRLTISGFLSYQQPAEIDFTGIHVACISGRNGAGKSTILDAMTWALFGEARRNDDSLINDAAEDRKAKAEFEFRYENADYLVRRQKEKGKSTTAEFYIRAADGIWKPLTEKRVADTNKRICDTLHMDYRTFINVSFFLQGKADQFTGQNATERKKILSGILDLGVWETYKTRTADLRKETEYSVRQLDRLILESEEELKDEDALKEKLASLGSQMKDAEKAYADRDTQWKLAKTAESLLNSQRDSLAQKQQDEDRQARQIRILQANLSDRQKELVSLRSRIADAAAIEQRFALLTEVRDRLEKLNAAAMEFNRLETARTRAENAVRTEEKQLNYEYSQLLKEKNELDRLLPEKDRLLSGLAQSRSELEQLTADYSRRPGLQERFSAISDKGEQLRTAAKLLETKISENEQKIAKLIAGKGAPCPTCGREMDEEHCRKHEAELREEIRQIRGKIAENEAIRVPMRAEYKDLQNEISRLDALSPRISNLTAGLVISEQNLKNISQRLESWEKDKKARFAEVEQALKNADFCAEERETIRSVSEKLSFLSYDRKEHEDIRAQLAQLAGAETAHQELIRSQSRIEPLEREISEKTAQIGEQTAWLARLREEREKAELDYQQKKEQMPDLDAVEKARNDALKAMQQLNHELAETEQRVRHLENARANLERYGAEFKEKQALIDRCRSLEKAFGKDGIPALLIEQAVPEIEDQANELLQRLSNGTMTLRMNTQGAYKSKKDEVKETLDIMITDPYGTREYEMFSGGEAFRINFSIRLALSRLLARRAGSRMQTLVIDEGFGSQDDEGRARLAEAITAVQNDFEKILVITHLSELKEKVPSRIEVEKTDDGSRVEVYP